MTRRWLAVAALLASLLLAACGAASSPLPTQAQASASASSAPVLTLVKLDAEPVQQTKEEVLMAFDREAAAGLLKDVPADLDLDTHALVCVFLGPRQTSGWSLDLRTATLTGDELEIAARENAPKGSTRPEVTYPADCGLLNRDALPSGELMVRADDTITGEFIAGTTVVVPEASNLP